MPRLSAVTTAILLSICAAACTRTDAPAPAAPVAEAAAPITNRIDIPAAVRRNLGITFARVQKRAVAATLRAPGRFELLPSARREYHSAMSGRIELLVTQYQRVEAGAELYRIDSPQWRQQQEQLAATWQAIVGARRKLASLGERGKAIDQHAKKLETEDAVWTKWVKQLEDLAAGGGGVAKELAEARAQLAMTHTREAEVEEEQAELAQLRVELENEIAGYRSTSPLLFADATGEPVPGAVHDLSLAAAASMTGLTVEELRKPSAREGSPPVWRTIGLITIRAQAAGAIESIAATNGSWVEVGRLIVSVVDPSAVQFRAVGLQSDLPVLRDGQRASIIPPRGGGARLGEPIAGTLRIGLEADAAQRKIDLLIQPQDIPAAANWVRAGVAGEAEITTADAGEQLAIPVAAVIRDGLTSVIFKRDPANPDKVIRMDADLGLSDGRWVVLESGVKAGDEVVLDGIYELMLASSGNRAKGGHFHADGTFHEGED